MNLDQPSDEDRAQAKPESIAKMRGYAEKFAEKSGVYLHPHPEITKFLVIGLASHLDELGRPLCPCKSSGGEEEHLDLRLRGDAEVQVLSLPPLRK